MEYEKAVLLFRVWSRKLSTNRMKAFCLGSDMILDTAAAASKQKLLHRTFAKTFIHKTN